MLFYKLLMSFLKTMLRNSTAYRGHSFASQPRQQTLATMSIKILASIRFLSFSDLDIVKTPIFNLTNHQAQKQSIIDSDFRKFAGSLANDSFVKNALGYSIIEDDSNDEKFIALKTKELAHIARQIETFLIFLWFVKDNSISLEQAFIQFPSAQKFSWWTSHNIFSMAAGQFQEVSFTSGELEEAVELLLYYTDICTDGTSPRASNILNCISSSQASFQPGINPNEEQNRVEKALSFLSTARSSAHIPQKITHYMSILECLFTTNEQQIVRKISSRVSHYLNDTEIKKTLREAYNIRSRFVHGDAIKKPHSVLCEIAIKTDDIIRRVLTRVVTIDSSHFLKNGLRKYLAILDAGA